MSFEKQVLFLGSREMKLRDGTILYAVNFFVEDSTLEVNVLGTNAPVMSAVKALSFGDTCTATFSLRKADRLYKLSLTSIA